MTDLPFDPLRLLREQPEKMRVPGGLLTKKGQQDYVGSVLAIMGTLFFNDAHTPALRDAVCECLEEYERVAKEHLTWLWREDPPEGPPKTAYRKAKSMRELMKQLAEDDVLSFAYVSGAEPHDAGEWEFQVAGLSGWQARMGDWGTSVLRFSVPLLYVEQHPASFQTMFVNFAQRLRALHGYGGHGLVLSLVRRDDNEPFEAYLSNMLLGLDAGGPIRVRRAALAGIKTVSWLTAISRTMVEKLGGLGAIRSELPMDWFALYDYGSGIVVQAGPVPEAAPADLPKPARLVLPNMLLKSVRMPVVGSLHRNSQTGEPRLTGVAAEEWLRRLDVGDAELMRYKRQLLEEPKLRPECTASTNRL